MTYKKTVMGSLQVSKECLINRQLISCICHELCYWRGKSAGGNIWIRFNFSDGYSQECRNVYIGLSSLNETLLNWVVCIELKAYAWNASGQLSAN